MEIAGKREVPLVKTWIASVVLAIIGLADSAYLSWVKLANATATCSNIGDCELVNTSRFSEIGGIPIAALGTAAYLAIVVLLAIEKRLPDRSSSVRVGVFGIALAGTLYSAYLTYVEIGILRAICPLCVLSSVVISAIFVLSVFRVGIEET